jgi:hypothetical protein
MRGFWLPSLASPRSSPSTKTCESFSRYWFAASARFRHQVTRIQGFSSQFLPLRDSFCLTSGGRLHDLSDSAVVTCPLGSASGFVIYLEAWYNTLGSHWRLVARSEPEAQARAGTRPQHLECDSRPTDVSRRRALSLPLEGPRRGEGISGKHPPWVVQCPPARQGQIVQKTRGSMT